MSVRLKVPTADVVVVATVSTELAPVVTVAGLNVPVAPPGRPLTDKLTDCALPDVS